VEVQLFSSLRGFSQSIMTADGDGFVLQYNEAGMSLYKMTGGKPSLLWSR
jgi:hypothetical protein